MKATALDPRDFAPEEALGRILAHDVTHERRPVFHKGHVIGPEDLAPLREAAGPYLHVLELEPGDLPEGEAARRLAEAVVGEGVALKGPVEGRYNVVADARGVLRLDRATLQALNELDDVSIFTLYDGQVVRPGEVLAGVKVTPLVTREAIVRQAEDLARGAGGGVAVHAFRPLRVGVVIREALSDRERERVLRRLGDKIAWFGSELFAADEVPDDPGAVADAFARQARAGAGLILATGGNALDPLDAMLQALARVGARLEAFGAPAHPGSLFWLAYLDGPDREVPLFGVASCGMFSKATSVDLLLPAVFAGERLDARRIATLWEGGLLNKQMAFKFPPYDGKD